MIANFTTAVQPEIGNLIRSLVCDAAALSAALAIDRYRP